jgi:uncharacterized membrane protein YdbT with pleckstrin-like domain
MLVLGVVAGLVSAIVDGRVRTTWVVIGVLGTFALLYARAQMRLLRRTYAITNRRLTIETGLLSRDISQARLERIQDIDVTQSMLERALDVGTVVFYTAAEVGSEFSFRGVEDPRGIVRTVDRALHELRAPERRRPAAYL